MSIKINYIKKTLTKSSSNLVLFVDEKFNIGSLKKYLANTELSYINDLLKTSDLKKNMFLFEINSKKKIMLISIKKELKTIRSPRSITSINYKNDYINDQVINSVMLIILCFIGSIFISNIISK